MIRGRPQPGVQTPPQPIRDGQGASILGPTNPPREAQAQDLLVPPRTDHGTLPSLRWSFADSHNRLEEGGWDPADDDPRAAHRHRDRRRQHAAQGRRGPGAALAQGG